MGVVAEMCSTDGNGECWSRLLVSKEKRISRARLMRGGGGRLPSGAAASCSSGGAWSSDGSVNCWKVDVGADTSTAGGQRSLVERCNEL